MKETTKMYRVGDISTGKLLPYNKSYNLSHYSVGAMDPPRNLEENTQHSDCNNNNNLRSCADGTCVSTYDLCPEEQLMNQNTILIMIVVGLAVVIFLIVLYCFQQRNRSPRHRRGHSGTSGNCDDIEQISLFLPPPTYDEVITTNLYPPTPQMQGRRERVLSTEEPPMTPPPNYDTALVLLARSHESVLSPSSSSAIPKRPSSASLLRRSISVDQLSPGILENAPTFQLSPIIRENPPVFQLTEHCKTDIDKLKEVT